jgi:hypothetical protein
MRRLLIVVALLALPAAADAQDPPAPRNPVPVRLQVVFERFQGEKRLPSEPYTMSVNANDRPGRIRMGVQVPMRMDRVGDRDVPGNVIYRDVGNAADCTIRSADADRYKIDCTFEQTSIASTNAPVGVLAPPLLRNFRSESGVILRHKESAQFTVGTDPVSGERLQVSLTLLVSN